MLGILVVTIIVIALVMMIFKPKLGMILLWPMLFLYPHYYMWQRQLLPLNIGIDDLFICAMFLIVVVRRNLMAGVPPQFGYAFRITFVFFILLLVSNMNSYMLVGVGFADYTKSTLKGTIAFLLAYSLVNTIDDKRDLGRVVFSFCFFAGIGGMLVILQNYFPGPMQIFTSPLEVEDVWLYGIEPRPSGAFMNANNAAVVMGVASLIIVSTLPLKSKYFRRTFRLICLCIMVLAILLTRSRSGFLSLVIPLTLMAFMGKNKRYAWLSLFLGIAIMTALPAIREALFERFTGTGEQAGFIAPIKLRFEGVLELWRAITFRRLILGQSSSADALMGHLTVHNAYLGIILNFGIFGTIWAIFLVTIMLHKTKVIKKHPDLSLVPYGSAIQWCLLSFALYGVVGSILANYYARYTLFFLVAIAQKSTDIVWQSSIAYDHESYVYIDQAEPVEYYPV